MKSGMIAAEVIFEALQNELANTDLTHYQTAFEKSWAYKELYQSRNFGPAMHKLGKFIGGAYNTLDQNIFNGGLPFLKIIRPITLPLLMLTPLTKLRTQNQMGSLALINSQVCFYQILITKSHSRVI